MQTANYVPEMCVWELTLKCNMRCIHCGSMAGRPREGELEIRECFKVADQLLALGCKEVSFIGGEVFLYEGWELIAERMSRGGAYVTIITNGFVMGDKQISQIKAGGLGSVAVSIDGMEANHDRIRNVRGSFRRAIAALDRLREEGMRVSVVTCITDFNYGDLEELYKLLVEHGVLAWQLQLASPMGNMNANRGYLIDPAVLPGITRFIRQKRHEGEIRTYAGDNIGYYDENEMYLRSFPGRVAVWEGCQAGIKVVGIDSVGNVKGCESIYTEEFIEGNLREETLDVIWNKEGNFSYNRNFNLNMLTGRCARCPKAALCRGGCRGTNWFNRGKLHESAYCCYPGNGGGA